MTQTPRKSKRWVELAPGFRLYREVVVQAVDYHGMDVEVTVTWSDEGQRLVVSRVDVKRRDRAAVTGEDLRGLALQQFVRKSVLASVRDRLTPGGDEDLEVRIGFGVITQETATGCRQDGPTDETLRWVAVVYRLALALGEPPTKAVREIFEVSQSTAGAWVAAARRAGHLDPSDGPGKAG